jgi:hypothetical protein
MIITSLLITVVLFLFHASINNPAYFKNRLVNNQALFPGLGASLPDYITKCNRKKAHPGLKKDCGILRHEKMDVGPNTDPQLIVTHASDMFNKKV